ncbi:MAG TPA: DUF5667 domain-containing protein [Candidatus Paceibacterota bacterium]|nr:DUF5667 domain-containing protein [Candidatus Paceibacterota bacterium]
MKSFDSELKKYADKVSLKAAERRELRERVLSYMEYHPLPKQAVSVEELRGIPSEAFTVFHFTRFHVRLMGGALALVLILAPLVAERSVPGDVLYLVKTGINEKIQKQLANSPYEKIEFETKLIERRVAEARSLAQEGKLSDDVKNQLAADVKEHSDAVQNNLSELRSMDKDGAAIAEITFNTSLQVQSAVLNADDTVKDTALIEGIKDVVAKAQEQVATTQEENKPSFGGLMAQVESDTSRAYELFGTVKKSATPEEVGDIDRRLSDIDRLVDEAKEMQQTDEGKAIDDLTKTLGLTQKLIAFMTDIDVHETVALEALVPVVPSLEERTALARRNLESVETRAANVFMKVDGIVDPGKKGKVTGGLHDADALAAEVKSSLDSGNIDAAEAKLAEVEALISDLGVLAEAPASTTGNGTGVGLAEGEGTSTDVGVMSVAATLAPEDTGTTTGTSTATGTPTAR